MFKFFGICVLLASVCIAAVVYGSAAIFQFDNGKPPQGGNPRVEDNGKVKGEGPAAPIEAEAPSRATTSRVPDREVRVVALKPSNATSQLLIIQGGSVQPGEGQEVPSERDGKILALATPILDGEFVPKDKVIEVDVAVLGVEYKQTDDLSIPLGNNMKIAMREPFADPLAPTKLYRFPRPNDTLDAGTTKVIHMRVRFRKLAENDVVREGQLVGIINPAVAINELETKLTNVVAAVSEVSSTKAMLEESQYRLRGAEDANRRTPGSVSRDDMGAARVTVDKYRSEKVQKEAAVRKTKQELSAAWTALDLSFIRASIPGRIQRLYKQRGEAVKNLDPVMKIQNTKNLKVEAQVEVQDALPLQSRVQGAEAYRAEANLKDKTDPKYAEKLREMADALTTVYVEVTKPVPPKAVLQRDLARISAVAVSRGPLPKIISANEDGMVRVWERVPGPEERWREGYRMNHHHNAVRALACSGPKASKNVLVTATSGGRVQLFDLGNLVDQEDGLVFGKGDEKARHTNAVNAVALNEDATLCASAGEDRAICLWDTTTGNLLRRKEAAHNNGITSLAFTPSGQLVSAGRDGRMVVWEWKEAILSQVGEDFRGRANAVAQLGIDPTGKQVLFDEGRELRVLDLADGHIVGTLENHGSTGTFSTMALFSPDGKTILTNGNAAGRLQLWRAPSATARAAELRQLLYSSQVTCGAFDSEGKFAVTGTEDHKLQIWELPRKEEAERPLDANLTYVEEFLDTGLRRVTVRATIKDAKDWVIPGSLASIVVPPRPAGR